MTGPAPSGSGSLDHHPHPNRRGWPLRREYKPSLCLNSSRLSLSLGTFPSGCRRGRAEPECPSKRRVSGVQLPVVFVGRHRIHRLSQAALLLSLLWMPALPPAASRLLSLPRALMSMASGSPPAQPSPASHSGYVPGSVSAAFVTCPNEKVAKEIARWGPQCGKRKTMRELGVLKKGALPPLPASGLGNPGLAAVVVRSEWGVPSAGLWWRSAWQPVSTSSLRLHPCESEEVGVDLTLGADWRSFSLGENLCSHLFSYEWKGKIEEDSEVLMVRITSPPHQTSIL